MDMGVISMIDNKIQITWTIQDIQDRYKKLYPNSTLSDKNAMKVLLTIKNNHDAEIGINWYVIDTALILFSDMILYKSGAHECK